GNPRDGSRHIAWDDCADTEESRRSHHVRGCRYDDIYACFPVGWSLFEFRSTQLRSCSRLAYGAASTIRRISDLDDDGPVISAGVGSFCAERRTTIGLSPDEAIERGRS